MSRALYASLYGPTVGDRVRLGDTALVVEIEADDTAAGFEPTVGFGKTVREGQLVASTVPPDEAMDVVIINVVVINLAYLIVGVVIVEVVFVYPGLGQLLIDAVRARDLPVVQATGLLFAAAYILLNLTADVLSIMTNPRLLHPR